jgi:hypothetical protein
MMKITTMKVSPVAHLQWLSVKLLNIIRRKEQKKRKGRDWLPPCLFYYTVDHFYGGRMRKKNIIATKSKIL